MNRELVNPPTCEPESLPPSWTTLDKAAFVWNCSPTVARKNKSTSPLGEVIRQMARSRTPALLLEPAPPGHQLASHPPLRGPSSHGLYELGICYEGEILMASGTRMYHLKPGDFAVIEPGAWHYESYRDRRRSYKGCWLCTAPGVIRCNFSSYRRRRFETHWLRGISTGSEHDGFFKDLVCQISTRRSGWQARTRRLAINLLEDLQRHTEGISQPPSQLTFEPLDKLLRIMEARFREPLEIQTLAREVGLTPNYLSSQFRKAFHTSFTNYLQILRVWHAQMLLDHGRPIKEVAAECGFRNVHYFTTVFTQKCRVTPGAYARGSHPSLLSRRAGHSSKRTWRVSRSIPVRFARRA